jgi:hypothetical protein
MKASKGDRLVVKGHHLGEPDRDAEILEVHGADGDPPFLVQWSDDGRIGLVFPGPDAMIEHLDHTQATS